MPGANTRLVHPEGVDIVSIESANATESDRPGPGRILGNVYSRLGRRVEVVLNDLARRRGLGPEAVALRVKNRLETAPSEAAHYIDKERAKQSKDLKKLIRYTESKTESTRKQALDSIADLAWQNAHIRDIFKSLHAAQTIRRQEPYLWDFYDSSLQLSSRLALDSIEDGKLSLLAKSYIGQRLPEYSVTEFIRLNPEESFLAIRVFNIMSKKLQVHRIQRILEEMEVLVVTCPEYVEWEELDKTYSSWFSLVFTYRSELPDVIKPSKALWRMCLSEEKLPRTYQSSEVFEWIEGLENIDSELYSHRLLGSLTSIDASDYVPMETTPSQTASRIRRFFNPADMGLGQRSLDFGKDAQELVPLGIESITAFCAQLANMVASEDQNLRQRVQVCSRFILSHSIHSRTLMLEAYSYTSFEGTQAYADLVEPTAMKCRPSADSFPELPIIRHCDEQGHVVHLPYGVGESDCTTECSIEYELDLVSEDVLQIEFLQGSPVQLSDSIVPIIAGSFIDGRRAFVAEASSRSSNLAFCAIAEATKPEDLDIRNIWSLKKEIPYSTQVFVLRYALEAYPLRYGSEEFMAGLEEGTDATGPYSWRFVRYVPRIEHTLDSEGEGFVPTSVPELHEEVSPATSVSDSRVNNDVACALDEVDSFDDDSFVTAYESLQ